MREILRAVPVSINRNAPKETLTLAKVVQRLAQDEAYRQVVLADHGAKAIELAKRGRSLRELSRLTGLSPTYLSLVANGKQRISLAAIQILLGECEGAEA
jgi:hypothetical protein